MRLKRMVVRIPTRALVDRQNPHIVSAIVSDIWYDQSTVIIDSKKIAQGRHVMHSSVVRGRVQCSAL